MEAKLKAEEAPRLRQPALIEHGRVREVVERHGGLEGAEGSIDGEFPAHDEIEPRRWVQRDVRRPVRVDAVLTPHRLHRSTEPASLREAAPPGGRRRRSPADTRDGGVAPGTVRPSRPRPARSGRRREKTPPSARPREARAPPRSRAGGSPSGIGRPPARCARSRSRSSGRRGRPVFRPPRRARRRSP